MKKKINRIKRIFIDQDKKVKSYGFIFVTHQEIKTKIKRKIRTNLSFIYYKNKINCENLDINDFDIVEYKNKQTHYDILYDKYGIEKDHITECINIYNRVMKLFIIALKSDLEIDGFCKKKYIDFFKEKKDTNDNDNEKQIYNYIYSYGNKNNRSENSYLNNKIVNLTYNVHIKIIDIYFYLIGYF